jgi:hypothetical protein
VASVRVVRQPAGDPGGHPGGLAGQAQVDVSAATRLDHNDLGDFQATARGWRGVGGAIGGGIEGGVGDDLSVDHGGIQRRVGGTGFFCGVTGSARQGEGKASSSVHGSSRAVVDRVRRRAVGVSRAAIRGRGGDWGG